jgi:GH25 family lysozyme M1 (1,4-beta-N-acetylmuramidase)
MVDVLISDWAMYQSDFHGDPNSIADKYNPAKWTVNIDFDKACASLAGVIFRVGVGWRKDPCFDRYLAGIKPTGKPWGIYHAFWPENGTTGSLDQAQLVPRWCPERPPLGVWGDLEAGNPNWGQTDAYLRELDKAYGINADVYSGGPFLNSHFDANAQAILSRRLLWIAGYPNYWPPLGWNKGADHTLHQFTDRYQLPGMTHLCDMSRVNPASRWPGALETEPDMDDTLIRKLLAELGTTEESLNVARSAVNAGMAGILRLRAALPAVAPAPPPVITHHMRNLTNQQVINIFNKEFGGLGKLESVLNTAQKATLYAQPRTVFYTGPSVEAMNLTAAEKARVIAVLPADPGFLTIE